MLGHRKLRSPGFSMVELLVVMVVIGILVALLLPAVQAARETARRMTCGNNLRQVGIALHSYHDIHKKLPFAFDIHGTGWTAMILPQLEQQPLYDSLIFAETGLGNYDADGSPNEAACAKILGVFRCPSATAKPTDNSGIPNRVPGSYTACISGTVGFLPSNLAADELFGLDSNDGTFYRNSSTKFAEIVDGLSNTILVGEALTDLVNLTDLQAMDHWYIGSPQIDADDGPPFYVETSEFCGSTGILLNAWKDYRTSGHEREAGFGSYHPGGAQFTLGDGSVRVISETIDRATFSALGTRDGRDHVGEF